MISDEQYVRNAVASIYRQEQLSGAFSFARFREAFQSISSPILSNSVRITNVKCSAFAFA